MPTRYASLSRCSELPERDVIAALIAREEAAAILSRIAEMPPSARMSKAFLGLVGRLATPACAWLEGDLAVELFDEEGGTKVRVMSEIGAGLRERVLPIVVLAMPLADLVAAFEKRADLATFLRLERVSSRCVFILASEQESVPMSTEFDISETSLAFREAPKAPEEVDSGWDDAEAV
jgi:hypothetical protein